MSEQKETHALPAKLFAALAKAQAEFPAISKNRTAMIRPRDTSKQSYGFRYADLESIIATTRPALTKHGLAIIQLVREAKLVTILAHEGGDSIESSMKLPDPERNLDLKTYGAEISYLRRYAYQSMVCVASDDDLDEDGEEAGDRSAGNGQKKSEPAKREFYSAEQFDANLAQWTKLIQGGKRSHDEIIATVEAKAPMTDEQKKKIRAIQRTNAQPGATQ